MNHTLIDTSASFSYMNHHVSIVRKRISNISTIGYLLKIDSLKGEVVLRKEFDKAMDEVKLWAKNYIEQI